MTTGTRPRRANGFVVAIDGPSGAGKSTITRRLAERLGYLHIDTGAMYRAVALAVQRTGLPITDDEAIGRLCSELRITLRHDAEAYRVLLDGEDVSSAIRTPEISLLTSQVSSLRAVRECLVRLQRDLGRDGGVVLEGRDIGTVVFPDAEVKFFLTASAEERGRRRWLELRERGQNVSLEETVRAVVLRDEQDSGRELAPLRQAADAVEVDTTGLAIDEVLARLERLVRERTG